MSGTLSMVLSIASAVLAVASAAFSVYTFYRNVQHDRRRDTLNAYNTLQVQALDVLDSYTGTQIKQILEGKDRAEVRKISRCLARLEHFSVGVNTKIYDRKTVYELAHGFLDKGLWYKLQPVLEKKQKGQGENYYQNYCDLAAWMRAQEKKGKREERA